MAQIDIIQFEFDAKALSVREVVGTVLAEFRYNQAPKLIKLFEQTVKTWNSPPGFQSQFRFAGGDAELWVVNAASTSPGGSCEAPSTAS